MSEVKKLINGVQACEKFVKQLELHAVTIEELETLGEIAPSVSENIQFLRDWVNNNTISTMTTEELATTPTTESCAEPWIDIDPGAEWRHLFNTDVMVSNTGKFFSITNRTVLKPAFIDGELRVVVDDTDQGTKRAAVLVTRAFGLHSMDRNNGDYIIAFKDGDRRNIALNNLHWVQEPPRNETLCLIEDICRRIVEFNGDVDKVLGEYEGSRPKVTEGFVKAIINKEIHSNVSNAFFIMMGGKLYPRTNQSEEQNYGMDTAGFLVLSGDKKMTKSLIRDKIERGHDLSITEKTVIVFMAMESIGGKKVPDVPTIARTIKNEFKIDMAFDFIEPIRNDYSSEIAKVFGR